MLACFWSSARGGGGVIAVSVLKVMSLTAGLRDEEVSARKGREIFLYIYIQTNTVNQELMQYAGIECKKSAFSLTL
jgi:hypothetical protein